MNSKQFLGWPDVCRPNRPINFYYMVTCSLYSIVTSRVHDMAPNVSFATYFIHKTSRNLSDKRVVASRWRYSHALPPSKMPLPGTLIQKRCLYSSGKFYNLRALISSKPAPARIYFLSIVPQLCCVPFHKEIWTLSK